MIGTFAISGRKKLRCVRGTPAVEGKHFHFRQAQHPAAKASGLVLANARSNLFDSAWDLKAGVHAGVLPDLGHFWPWLNDLCVHALDGLSDELKRQFMPPVLRTWPLTDTSREPLTIRGIQWPEVLFAAGEESPTLPSSLRSRADIDAVLATPEATSAVVRGDTATVERLSSVTTTSSALQVRAALGLVCSVKRGVLAIALTGAQGAHDRARARVP